MSKMNPSKMRRTQSPRTIAHTALIFLVLGLLTLMMVFALKAALTGSL